MIKSVAISELRTDGGTQPRAYTDHQIVDDYKQAMIGGAKFPPVTVFFDDHEYWLADGFHRMLAAFENGDTIIECDVRKGGVRDAILFSVGANATHGKPRTNADKRRSVETLLNDSVWSGWSSRQVAKACAVTHPFVEKIRNDTGNVSSVAESPHPETRTYRDKQGRVKEMHTTKIGKSKRQEPVEESSHEEEDRSAPEMSPDSYDEPAEKAPLNDRPKARSPEPISLACRAILDIPYHRLAELATWLSTKNSTHAKGLAVALKDATS